jgi:sarcosine oxidase, subunit gamma
MSDPTPAPVSALAGARARDALIDIEDTGLRGQMTLKGNLADPEIAAAVREVAGVDMPGTWRAAFAGVRGAVWMAPDELLLLVPYADAPAAVARLDEMLAGRHCLALDVSDMRAILRLTGSQAGEVLAKGVPCDLRDRAFPPGSARRTTTAGMAVALWRRGADAWEIAAFRSQAHHLMAFIEDGARPGSAVGFRLSHGDGGAEAVTPTAPT